jgi:hypothetical protein
MRNKLFFKVFFIVFTFFSLFSFEVPLSFAAFSCTVSTTCSGGVVLFNMKDTVNSHAESSSQSNYPNLVCCSGVTGLTNSCSGTYATVLRLSGTTNAHVEEGGQATSTYNGNDACISVPSGGSVSVGYQDNSCTGFDTTVVSMATPVTNSHVGDASAYTRKVCASATGSGSPPPPPPPPPTPVSGGNGIITPELKAKILKLADFNHDGKVDILDLSILLYYYDQTGVSIDRYDLNNNVKVDFPDVSILFYYWDILR